MFSRRFKTKSSLFKRDFSFEPKPYLAELYEEDPLSPSSKFPPSFSQPHWRQSGFTQDSTYFEEGSDTSPVSPSSEVTIFEEDEESDLDDNTTFIFDDFSDTDSIVESIPTEAQIGYSAKPKTIRVIPAKSIISIPPQPRPLSLEEFGRNGTDFLDLSEGESHMSSPVLQEHEVSEFTALYGKHGADLQAAVQELLEDTPNSILESTVVKLVRKEESWLMDESPKYPESIRSERSPSLTTLTTRASSISGSSLQLSIPEYSQEPGTFFFDADSMPNSPAEEIDEPLRISWLPHHSAVGSFSSSMDFFMAPVTKDSESELYLTPEPSPLFPKSMQRFSKFSFPSRTSSRSSRTFPKDRSSLSRNVLERMNSLSLRHYSIDMAAGIPHLAADGLATEAYGELYWPENA